MIVLKYPTLTPQLNDWIDTLEKLALAHRLEMDDQLPGPVLSHSGKDFTTSAAITAYLDQLYAEREQWWYCTCDRGTTVPDASRGD